MDSRLDVVKIYLLALIAPVAPLLQTVGLECVVFDSTIWQVEEFFFLNFMYCVDWRRVSVISITCALGVAVEQNYKDLRQKRSADIFKRSRMVQKASIGLMYLDTAPTLNIVTFFYKDEPVETYFDCDAPDITACMSHE